MVALTNLRVAPETGYAAVNTCKGGLVNTLLTANTPKLITVPTWTASDSSTPRAKYVIFSSTDNFFASYVYSDGSVTELTDLVTNGAFASDTAWTKGTGWTISGGVATSDASQAANSDLSQTPSQIVADQWYYVTFTVSSYSAGNVRPVVGGTAGTNRAANGTFSEMIKAGSSATILLRADLDFAGSIDNFSAVPAAHIPDTDDTTGRGSDLNPNMRDISGVTAISLISAAAAKITMAFYK